MNRVHVDANSPQVDLLEDAAGALRGGQVVAFPTETVYGLGANALDEQAVRRIFEAKGRPSTNPLIVHVAKVEDVHQVVREWPEAAQRLAEAFWPGPLTIVLRKTESVPLAVTAGLETVGVRVPSHPVARALIGLAGVPVAAPSANRYMGVSPTTADHVIKSLAGAVDWVVDAGPTQVGLESTVVSLVGLPRVLRLGMIGWDEIKAVLPELQPFEDDVVEGVAAQSPGLARRHYAPTAKVIIGPAELRGALKSRRVGLMAFRRPEDGGLCRVMSLDPVAYARELYSALHELDEAGCEYIVVEPPPRTQRWGAIWDRLKRATESEG